MPRARALAHAVLGEWAVDQDVLHTAELLLSELVTNALRAHAPSGRQVGVRIARSTAEGLLRLQVSDESPGRPEVRTPGDDETSGRGLLLVEALAHRWGVEEHEAGTGKTVWAELKAPDLVAEPAEREIAAAMVRPNHLVRVWGEWRTVVSTRNEQHDGQDGHDPILILNLDEGPPLRVQATEPLTVRHREEDAADV
ncbi:MULTISPECIES: ATP-binding protein [Streptomyces]|uniref:ATP-binding protein n=1 Tax=Streptomyces ortus TaxID=2867268 RepID=A0ABT3V830_9ACTN|nr:MULTISPECIES: ATP-binding protein [Streptomyces]MCX4234448.1 ATP-binding protein [Streptomyces ortus]